jgi:hypothetical protein
VVLFVFGVVAADFEFAVDDQENFLRRISLLMENSVLIWSSLRPSKREFLRDCS